MNLVYIPKIVLICVGIENRLFKYHSPQKSDFSGEYGIGFALGKNLGKATEKLAHSLFHNSRLNLPDWSNVKRHILELICLLSCFSSVQLFVTLCTVACQAPLSLEFSRQEYWSGLRFSSSKESSQPRDRTCVSYVSCIGSQVLYQ